MSLVINKSEWNFSFAMRRARVPRNPFFGIGNAGLMPEACPNAKFAWA